MIVTGAPGSLTFAGGCGFNIQHDDFRLDAGFAYPSDLALAPRDAGTVWIADGAQLRFLDRPSGLVTSGLRYPGMNTLATATGTAVGYSVPSTEPRQTALKNLAGNASPGNQISTGDAAKLEAVTGPTVDANGVHWRVRVSSIQYARTALLTSAIAGRSFDDAKQIAEERGFKVVQIVATPGWLPRMPLLDSRIAITIGEPTITASGS